MAFRNCNVLGIDSCRIRWSARDGISCSSCAYISVTNCSIEHCDDDAITSHSEITGATPVRHHLVIANNRIVDSQGIRVMGAKLCQITGNVIERCRAHGISVGINTVSGEGCTPVLGLTIANNVITDVINRNGIDGLNAEQYYIFVQSNPYAANGLNAAPTFNDTTDATGKTIIAPYSYFNVNAIAGPHSGGHFVVIRNNICARTLPTVATYSTWGFGQMFTRNGWLDHAISAAEIITGLIGIDVLGAFRGMLIDGNQIHGMGTGISFGVTIAQGLREVTVSHNSFFDHITGGVVFAGGVPANQDVLVAFNYFNLDPYCTHANRGNNGAWANASTPNALYGQSATGYSFVGNHVRNAMQLIQGNGAKFIRGNHVYGQFAAAGYNAGNKGVAICPRSSEAYITVWEDADPASATYGNLLNACTTEASAMPATGYYLQGHYVRNTVPAVAGSAGSKYLLTGWRRLTTGNAHVLNTDWSEEHTLTGT